MSDQCPRCKGWLWASVSLPHKCPPRFEVATADDPDDWSEVYAHDHEAAAEKFAEDYEDNCAEYRIAAGKEVLKVLVRSAPLYVEPRREPEAPKTFLVHGEYQPHYSAMEVP